MNNFPLILGALGPIVALILLGLGLRRMGFPGDGFWPAAERFTYFILFPALLIHHLSLARLGDYAVRSVAAVIVTLLLGMTAVVYTIRPWLAVDGPGFTSVYQGVIRFNTYVGLAVVLAVFHTEGGTVAALVMAIMIPLINMLCVLVLVAHVGGAVTVGGVVRGLVTNPLILACLLGIGLNVTGIGLPWGSAAVLEILARAALPLGLLAVGAGLRLDGLAQPRLLIGTSALKLLGAPALAGMLCGLVEPGRLETAVLVTFTALPGASASYILARQMGGDAPLIAAIVTVETALAIVTLPLVLVWIV
ncbi:MAG TPA: AEC family transporter [Candidatus Competibacter sp.]|nr:AEC family transporter [Candidatus Competibacter sp.]HRF63146.1 AEC family transporter [Candidatus Competibacter sp.]HRX60323.1 AEC family transporter [Candidatus Competibacter sp.]